MTEIKRREKFRDVWLDILHSISGLCEVGKWSKNVSKLDVVDVSNGRAALSGSFINVRAPNFLQPKTSLSSCRRRPLFHYSSCFLKSSIGCFFSLSLSLFSGALLYHQLLFGWCWDLYTASRARGAACYRRRGGIRHAAEATAAAGSTYNHDDDML